ncbi:MAG: pyridoxal phosphate-dependent aminotransferase [Bacteroidales bacterium]|nr:pyridoxal phosphate-dependent aminotransferase [Bacteroidales bacterium]
MYNFDEKVTRKNSNCYKWDAKGDKDLIPLWVADMDFKTAPPIIAALHDRVEHGIFGYTKVPKEYFEAICQWFDNEHNWKGIEPKDILYTIGVVPAISAVIKAITNPGDKVLMTTPIYNCFYSSIRNNGCVVESSSLVSDKNGRFSIDFDDFEKKCKDPQVKACLFCNPHNPTSRVWTREELTRVARICKENGVFVISDEIHCEIMMPGFSYTPFGSLNPEDLGEYAVCTSPSKAFNIAGLQNANIICKDLKTRKKIDKAININEVCDVNPFGVLAVITAYTNPECRQWLGELNNYIFQNYQKAKEIINQRLPEVLVTPQEGTYLMWANFKELCPNAVNLEENLIDKANVWINPGTLYGDDAEHYMRINLATQQQNVVEGLDRVCKYFGR